MSQSWEVNAPSAPGAPATPAQQLFGRDIFFDVSNENGADLKVTRSGDWMAVDGELALRQWILRVIVTNPGEWKTLPDFGVGARAFVKGRNTRANRDYLTERLRSQIARNPRVQSVGSVIVQQTDTGMLIISVTVVPRGQSEREKPVVVALSVG